MANRFVENARRLFLAIGCLAAGLMALAPNDAAAVTWAFDNGGVPFPLSEEVPEEPDPSDPLAVMYGGELDFTETILHLNSGIFNAGGTVAMEDINLGLKLRHPRINEISVHLVAIPRFPALIRIYSILDGTGCSPLDFGPSTTFNQDVAVYFDNEAGSSVDFFCDRSIPTLAGRLIPTSIRRFSPPEQKAFLGEDSFGEPPTRFDWVLVVRDYGDTGAKASLVEWTLHFNQVVESDLTPRELTPTSPAEQSGNNLVTETDYVAVAQHLLGYNYLDNRVFSAQFDDLTRFPSLVYANVRRSSIQEFTVLDSAPASSMGDGVVSVADFVQATRYAASLDELKPSTLGPMSRDDRMLFGRFLDGAVLVRGEDVVTTFSILMRSKQAETEIGFGLEYDPTLLDFVGIERGDCVPENAIFQINRELEGEGLVALRVGVDPDQTFLCEEGVEPPLLLGGTVAAPIDIINVTTEDSELRPVGLKGILSTSYDPIDFSGPSPRIRVHVDYDAGKNTLPVSEYRVNLLIDHTKLDIENVVAGDFGSAPGFSIASIDESFGATHTEYLFERTGINSTLTGGRLFSIDMSVLSGRVTGDSFTLASDRLPNVVFRRVGRPINRSDNSFLSLMTKFEYDSSATEYIHPIQTTGMQDPNYHATLKVARYGTGYCGATSGTLSTNPSTHFAVDVQLRNNVRTAIDAQLRIRHSRGLRMEATRYSIDGEPFIPPSISMPFISIVSVSETDDSVYVGLAGSNSTSVVLNGTVVRLRFYVTEPPADGTYFVELERYDAPSFGLRYPIRNRRINFDCATGTFTQPATQSDFEPVVAEAEPNSTIIGLPSEGSVIATIDSITGGAVPVVTVSMSANNFTATPITQYSYVVSYDESSVRLVESSVTDIGFGVPTVTRIAKGGPLGGLPNIPTSNYGSYRITARNPAGVSAASFPLSRVQFEITNPTGGLAIHLTAIPPRNENVEVARAYFRARPGVGTVATALRFTPNVFFDGLAVRNPLGAPIYTSYIDSGATVIDPNLPRPTVRIVDTVLRAASEGDVLIALDSVGEETGIGYTLQFNPAELQLLSVAPGRDIPSDAFFFTNPNSNDVTSANADGRLRMLISLQPGNAEGNNQAFEPGMRILANLRFRVVKPTPGTSNLHFLPLSDSLEVVDALAIPLVTRFPVGTVNVAAANCAYTVNPAESTYPTLGGSGEFTVTATTGCPWVATTSSNWITVLNAGAVNFSQEGRVIFTVSPNSGSQREGTIQVGGEIHRVVQEGCAFLVTPPEFSLGGDGGTGTFNVLTDDPCAWQVQPVESWITITSSRFNTGSKTVSFRVDSNVGAARVGRIRLNNGGPGLEFIIRQEICEFAIEPEVSELLPPQGADFFFELTAQTFCGWTVKAKPAWVTVTSESTGVGPARLTFRAEQNLGSGDREGFIDVADQRFTVRQEGNIDCEYEITTDRAVLPSGGGVGTVALVTQGSCPWEVESDAEWLTITTGASGTGSTSIGYRVAPNTDVTRVGHLTINDLVFTVQQFGANQFAFQFLGDAEGWNFARVSGVISGALDDSEITLPGGLVERGRLLTTVGSNDNTFGFWESPVLRLDAPLEESQLFLADYRITTNIANQAMTPTLRGRVSTTDFALTNEYWIFSAGNGNFSPPAAGRTYTQLFEMPAGIEEFRVYLDVINYLAEDAGSAAIGLESLTLIPVDQGGNEDANGFFVLANNQAGFTPVPGPGQEIAGFTKPNHQVTSRGLAIGSVDTLNAPSQTIFGYWTKDTDVSLTTDRVYRVSFQVSARSNRGQDVLKSKVPGFRLRLNSSSFKHASVLHVSSPNENAPVPTVAGPVTYEVYMVGVSQLSADKIVLNFDFLMPQGSTDDPAVELVLESVRIRSYDMPARP